MVGISSIHPRRFISSNTSKPSASGITTSSSSAAILPSCAASVAMASLPSAASRISKFFSNTLTRIARFSSESSAISSFLSSMKKHLLPAAQRRDSRLGRHGGADRAAGS